jgi:hypothetical protein
MEEKGIATLGIVSTFIFATDKNIERVAFE